MRRAGLAVLLLVLAGCGGEETPEAASIDFVVMEEEADPADVEPPTADDEEAVDPVEPPDDADDPADDPAEEPDDPDPGAGTGVGMTWDEWEAECVADGEDPEACRCLIDVLRRVSNVDRVTDAGIDDLMDEAFEQYFDEVLECFGGAFADD